MASPGPSGNKLSEMLRAGSQPGSAQQYHDEMQSQQQRMAVMAAAVSAGKTAISDLQRSQGAIARSDRAGASRRDVRFDGIDRGRAASPRTALSLIAAKLLRKPIAASQLLPDKA